MGSLDVDGMSRDNFLTTDDMHITDLDFDLLQDLPLPPDDLSLLDDIWMHDDSSSTSNSFSPESYVTDSIPEYPPLTPPSPTYSCSSSSSSQLGRVEIKLEPALSPTSVNDVADMINQVNPKARSGRGRSASIEAPEVQALKRHIRMIRNRESACQSRKKKKDYVTSVEQRVKELETENAQLKQENSALKKRLHDLGQDAKTNVIIPSRILVANTPIKPKPVRIAPAVIVNSSRPKIIKINSKLPATAAKLVLLGVCCFMFVSFRAPQNYMNNTIGNSTHPMPKMLISSEGLVPRSFLPETSGKSSLSYESERHAHQDEDYALPKMIKKPGLRGLWDNMRLGDNYLDKNDSSLNGTLSGTGNSTRSRSPRSTDTVNHRRLAGSEFGNEAYKKDHVEQLNRRPKYANETLGNAENCALFNQTEALRVQNRLKGIFGKRPEQAKRKHVHKPIVYSLIDSSTKLSDNKGLTVYDETIRRYSKVFDQLERREDTYYVISLAIENQLLFSAKSPNITSRPKMSFLLPWRNETRGGKEELMQIDCEVTGVFTLNKNKPPKN